MATTSMLHSSSSFGMRSMLVMAEPIRVDGEPSKKSPGYYLLEAFRGRFRHEVQLRKQAYQQLMASYEFNQGLLGFLLPHGEGVHTKARASVAAAVARLDLDKTTAVQQQQLAEQCVRRLFAGFCSAKALESTTVVHFKQSPAEGPDNPSKATQIMYSWYEGRELILAKKSEWYYQQNEALLSVQQAQVELINKLLAAASREGLLRLLAEELRQQRGVMSSVVAAVVEELRSAPYLLPNDAESLLQQAATASKSKEPVSNMRHASGSGSSSSDATCIVTECDTSAAKDCSSSRLPGSGASLNGSWAAAAVQWAKDKAAKARAGSRQSS